ncbi:MAG: hypothetical protein EB127_00355 [Alphaproteobacteria bacterium]|nr:hypothetical protein [Alphaproteobacteria bacterium]
MKLVSFDVGLRNLAYCVIQGTTRHNLKILNWDLIDVMAEENGIMNCYKCKAVASWKRSDTYSCTKHKTKEKTYTKSALTKMSLTELQVLGTTFKIEEKNKKEYVGKLYEHYSRIAWKRCVKSCKAGSVVDLAPLIASSLKARTTIWKNSDMIIFEQQPDKRMMAVQAMMHMWFICQGFNVKAVSAVHKLTNIVTVDDATKTYKGRKKTGIIHASALVPSEWNEFMMKHPKKDDLADCFLQGLWFMENGRH